MRTLWMVSVSVLAAAAALPHSAVATETTAAQDTTEVTVIATKTEKKVADAPATVSVITAQQIDDQLVTDLKDLVKYEPGVAVPTSPARFTLAGASTGRDGDSGFNIRGIEGNRVLMEIDGIRVPDAFSFGAQAVGRGGYADLDLIKSVEILRGPASALYGSDGVAGAVSFTTKDPQDILKAGQTFGGQAKVSYAGANDSWAKGLVVAGQSDTWSSMIAYTRRDGHEQETHGTNGAANTSRTKADPQDVVSNALLAKLIYRPADGQRLRLTLDHDDNSTDTNVLSAIALPPLSSTSTIGLLAHDTSRRTRASLDYRYRGAGFIDGVDAVVFAQSSKTGQYGWEDRNTAVDRTRINLFDTRVYGGNLDLTSHAVTGALTHTFTYGGDVSVTREESVRDGTVAPVGESFPTRAFPTTDFTRTGLFVQDEIDVGSLALYPAVRYDSFDLKPHADALLTTFTPKGQNGSHVSPKLSLVYKFTPQISLFANAANGFKAPAPDQVNNSFSNLIYNYKSLPNPNLHAETSDTLEAGLRYNSPRWSGSVAAYSGHYHGFIEQVQIGGTYSPTDPGLFQYVNLDEVKLSGVEGRARVDLGSGFTFNASASTSQGTQTTNGQKSPLISIEPWKAVAGLSYHSGPFGGAFTITHSAQKDPAKVAASSQVSCQPNCYVPPAFTIADVTAYWNLTSALTLRAGVFNLTNEKYAWWSDVRGIATTQPVDAWTQPGRNASVSLAYRF